MGGWSSTVRSSGLFTGRYVGFVGGTRTTHDVNQSHFSSAFRAWPIYGQPRFWVKVLNIEWHPQCKIGCWPGRLPWWEENPIRKLAIFGLFSYEQRKRRNIGPHKKYYSYEPLLSSTPALFYVRFLFRVLLRSTIALLLLLLLWLVARRSILNIVAGCLLMKK